MTKHPRLFFSHSNKDSALLQELVTAARIGLGLQQGDIRCTSLDGYDIASGEDIVSRLRDDGAASNSLIAVVTPESLKSTWVMFELGARWGIERHLVVVVASGADVESLPEPIRMRRARRCSVKDLEGLFIDVADELNVTFDIPATRRYLEAAARLSEASRQFRFEADQPPIMYDVTQHATASARIERPRIDAIVQRRFAVEVELVSKPIEGRTLWLFHESNGQGWPKVQLHFDGSKCEGTSVEGGTPLAGAFTLTVVELDTEGQRVVAEWAKHGADTGHFPGLRKIQGASRVTSSRVILEA